MLICFAEYCYCNNPARFFACKFTTMPTRG